MLWNGYLENIPYVDLTQIGTLHQTDNVVDLTYHTGFKCCTDYEFDVTNAYLYETIVYKRHGNSELMESPAGVTSHCEYLSGFCALRDGSALLWQPEGREECQYIPNRTFLGRLQDSTWLSDSGELVLTFTKSRVVQQDPICGGTVEVSDQGMACSHANVTENRNRREIDGRVTDAEVNAKLQALELRIQTNYNHLFQSSVKINCQAMQSIAQLVVTALERNPTLAARHLLNHTYLYAQLTHNLISVYPCEEIQQYSVTTSDTCSTRIPLEALIAGEYKRVWLDAHTNIITSMPSLDDCSMNQEIPVSLNGKLFYYHPISGNLTPITRIHDLNLIYLNYSASILKNETVIYELLLYGWNEFSDKFSLNDMTGTLSHQTKILEHLGVTSGFSSDPLKQAGNLANNVVDKGTFSFLKSYGVFDVKQVWIFACCLIVTIRALCSCFLACTGAKNFVKNPKDNAMHYIFGRSYPVHEPKDTNIAIAVHQTTGSNRPISSEMTEEVVCEVIEMEQATQAEPLLNQNNVTDQTSKDLKPVVSYEPTRRPETRQLTASRQ